MIKWMAHTSNAGHEHEGLYYVISIASGLSHNLPMTWSVIDRIMTVAVPSISYRTRAIIARRAWESSSLTNGVTTATMSCHAFVTAIQSCGYLHVNDDAATLWPLIRTSWHSLLPHAISRSSTTNSVSDLITSFKVMLADISTSDACEALRLFRDIVAATGVWPPRRQASTSLAPLLPMWRVAVKNAIAGLPISDSKSSTSSQSVSVANTLLSSSDITITINDIMSDYCETNTTSLSSSNAFAYASIPSLSSYSLDWMLLKYKNPILATNQLVLLLTSLRASLSLSASSPMLSTSLSSSTTMLVWYGRLFGITGEVQYTCDATIPLFVFGRLLTLLRPFISNNKSSNSNTNDNTNDVLGKVDGTRASNIWRSPTPASNNAIIWLTSSSSSSSPLTSADRLVSLYGRDIVTTSLLTTLMDAFAIIYDQRWQSLQTLFDNNLKASVDGNTTASISFNDFGNAITLAGSPSLEYTPPSLPSHGSPTASGLSSPRTPSLHVPTAAALSVFRQSLLPLSVNAGSFNGIINKIDWLRCVIDHVGLIPPPPAPPPAQPLPPAVSSDAAGRIEAVQSSLLSPSSTAASQIGSSEKGGEREGTGVSMSLAARVGSMPSTDYMTLDDDDDTPRGTPRMSQNDNKSIGAPTLSTPTPATLVTKAPIAAIVPELKSTASLLLTSNISVAKVAAKSRAGPSLGKAAAIMAAFRQSRDNPKPKVSTSSTPALPPPAATAVLSSNATVAASISPSTIWVNDIDSRDDVKKNNKQQQQEQGQQQEKGVRESSVLKGGGWRSSIGVGMERQMAELDAQRESLEQTYLLRAQISYLERTIASRDHDLINERQRIVALQSSITNLQNDNQINDMKWRSEVTLLRSEAKEKERLHELSLKDIRATAAHVTYRDMIANGTPLPVNAIDKEQLAKIQKEMAEMEALIQV
jgi:hypothetical protein